jgi:hypothetical protein
VVNADFDRTRKCVEHYVKLGLCPLPSRMDIKGPMLPTYAEHYGPTPVPSWVYRKWTTTNVQILTGTKTPTITKIIVVDLDGPEALAAWDRIAFQNGFGANVPGWISQTGSGGRHHYFLLPDGVDECAGGIIWGLYDTFGETGKGSWCKHKEVRILADNALVVAPPSVHVDTGHRYEWLPSGGPNRVRLPMVAPDWLLKMPRLSAPRFTEPPAPRVPVSYTRQSDKYYTREEVINAVGDHKFEIACREWGLISHATQPNPNGWCPCYMPGREDPRYSKPSGSFNFRDGTLQDRKDLTSISFFDLSVVLGVFKTWQACRDALGDRYIGKRGKEATSTYGG